MHHRSPRKTKGLLALALLDAIGDTLIDAGELLELFLSAPNPYRIRRTRKRYNKLRAKRVRTHAHRQEALQRRRRYYNLVAWLRRDRLIRVVEKNEKRLVKLTVAGRERRKSLRERSETVLPDPKGYNADHTNQLVIVCFDVPEEQRKKRDWLRSALKNMGLQRVQQSVWIGKVKLPADFLEDIARFNLTDAIEVFAVTRTGSLRHVV